MAGSTYTYDKLPAAERDALPADTAVIAALGEALQHEHTPRPDAGANAPDHRPEDRPGTDR
jgi:hypothetical protein